MIVSILLIVIMITALVFLFYFFAQRTREDVTTLEEDERKKRDAKGEAKSAQQQQKEQQQQQAVPVLWLDSRKGYKLKGSTEIVEWTDARGAQYGIVEVQTDRMPMPTAPTGTQKGIGLTSAMLLSRQRPTKSANCTLLVACELSAPGEWGTIFGHFNRGSDADGVPWHSKDVQLRVTNNKRVSWHTAGDNERATIAFDEIWPSASSSSSSSGRGPVVFACTMVSDETSSTMRIEFETATTRGSRSTKLKRTMTDGDAPIVVGSSFANEYSNVVLYECVYYTTALSPTDLETKKQELVRQWV